MVKQMESIVHAADPKLVGELYTRVSLSRSNAGSTEIRDCTVHAAVRLKWEGFAVLVLDSVSVAVVKSKLW